MSGVSAGFSLLDEPWVLVRTGSHGAEEVSLRDLFRRASEIGEIVGDVPTQGFAILRLALAVLHRALGGPRDERAWDALWAREEPPVDVIDAYFDRYSERFDLFHPRAPFFQVAGLHTARNEFSGLEILIADVPPGHPYFTTRIGRGIERITAAEAARWLVHLQAFDISGIKSGAVGDARVKGGRGYPIGTGWAGNLGGLYVAGENLWQTLVLNAIPYDQPSLAVFGTRDRPAWEAEPPDGPSEDPDVVLRPYGPTDLYTWQSRRVLLKGDRDGVTGVVVANGDKLTPQNRWRFEPMTAWRRSEAQQKKLGQDLVYMPLAHVPARAMWRGLSSLLPLVAPRGKADGGQRYVTASVVEWAARQLGARRKVTLRAIGMAYGTMNAKIDDIIDDRLFVSTAVLSPTDPAIPQTVIEAIEASEAAVSALRNLASNLVRAAGGSDSTLSDGARARAAEQAYAAFDVPFRRWLADLSPDVDSVEARSDWYRQARRIVRRLGADLVNAAPPDAWVGRVVNNRRITTPEADGWFQAAVATALPLPDSDSPATPEEISV